MSKADLDEEIREYQFLLQDAIEHGRKDDIKMWRRAMQTAKVRKRRIADS